MNVGNELFFSPPPSTRMIAVDSPFLYVKCSKKQSLNQHFFINYFFFKNGMENNEFPPGGEKEEEEKNTCFPIFFLLFFSPTAFPPPPPPPVCQQRGVSPLSDNGQRRKKEERGKKGIICGDLVGGKSWAEDRGLPADTSFSPAKTGDFPNCLEISFVFLKNIAARIVEF